MNLNDDANEDDLLRSVTLLNAKAILKARQRAEQDLVEARDALERKTIELAHSLAMMRATLESTTDGILVTDGNGKITGFNEKYVSIWRLQPDWLASREHQKVLRLMCDQFEDPRFFLDEIESIYADSPTESFHLLKTRDGRYIERSSRIQFVEGWNVGRVWSFRDITERQHLLEAERAARSEAERISLMKDEFLATLSHELRTPLNAILGWSQVLLNGTYEPEDLVPGLESIARNAKAQTQLIEDLLDMSRIISGKVRLDVQTVDLASVVDAAVDSVNPSADAKGIRLRRIVDPAAGPVSGDPHRLQQVIWNLLSNAIKFTPRGGHVEVTLARIDSHLEITVNDSGIGIAPDLLPHVFERFRQADSSTTRKHGGLGLGLSIVKQLVELHGGDVRVDSAGLEHGTQFVVSLPLSVVREGDKRCHPSAPNVGLSSLGTIDLNGIKVLVVDDESDARELTKRVLVLSNADVFTAASADQGLAALKLHKPDVLVSDIGMPDKDGYQLIREVRKLAADQGGRTPAVALTAFARSEDRTRAMIAGFQIHVSKPIDPHELLATVASLAGNLGIPTSRG